MKNKSKKVKHTHIAKRDLEVEQSRHCEGGKSLPTEAIRLINNIFGKILPNPFLKKNFSPLTHFSNAHKFALKNFPLPLRAREGARKRYAFTLAEVLITLGIIGVVAAITLPSVIEKHQKQVTVTKLRKVYSILNQAWDRAKNDYGDITSQDLASDTYDFGEKYFKPYLNIVDTETKDLKYEYSDLSGTAHNFDLPIGKSAFILEDGTLLFFHYFPHFAQDFYIVTDINGINKPPNKTGRDLFAFTIYKNAVNTYTQYDVSADYYFGRRIYVLGNGGTSGQCNKNADGRTGVIGAGSYCSRLIELDGWQIKDDYPW